MADDTPVEANAAIEVAALREALRSFLRDSELIAQECGPSPRSDTCSS